MFASPALAIKLCLIILACGICVVCFYRVTSKRMLIIICVFLIWVGFMADVLAQKKDYCFDKVTIRATGERNDAAVYTQIWLRGFTEGQRTYFPNLTEGTWVWQEYAGHDLYCYFPETDERWTPDVSSSITMLVPPSKNRTVKFVHNQFGGIAEIICGGNVQRVDTYQDTERIEPTLSVAIPDSSRALLQENELRQLPWFLFVFFSGTIIIMAALTFVLRSKEFEKLKRFQFLFEELVKRDFTLKYKRTALGIFWSVLSPLLTLLVMNVVLGNFFGGNIDHYIIYLFCGQLVFNYFNESTCLGMSALLDNSGIFTKVNVPKYLFVFSKSMASLISFLLTFAVLLTFVLADGLPITSQFFCLVFPSVCLVLFNIGVGLVLSALFVFFRDMQYLWNIFTLLLMYMSAVFYNVSGFPDDVQSLFFFNPIYVFIYYFRSVVLDGTVPSAFIHLLAVGYSAIAFGIGAWIYKRYNHEFLYYV